MNESTAKITYLFHSGYAVETAKHFFIFDYYQPIANAAGTLSTGVITSDFLKTKSNVYVFASHSHGDHFDPIILEWGKNNPDITYILSSDIKLEPTLPKCHFMSEYEEIQNCDVSIKTFSSTDLGVSFLVQTDGLSIFHAGDLNWWHWSGDSKEAQILAESAFKAVIDKIAGHSIDIAFFPVDRRLAEFYSLGAEYFAAKVQPKLLLPMHFGDDLAATTAFAEKANQLSLATVKITHQGQEILF